MKFKFKIQQYQTDAVEAVVKVFDGQPYSTMSTYTRDLGEIQRPVNSHEQLHLFEDMETQLSIFNEDYDLGYSNSDVLITDDKLIANIRSIQAASNLHESESIYRQAGLGVCSLDVEMETGLDASNVCNQFVIGDEDV